MNNENKIRENECTIKSMYRLLDEFKDTFGEKEYLRIMNKISNKENENNTLYDSYI